MSNIEGQNLDSRVRGNDNTQNQMLYGAAVKNSGRRKNIEEKYDEE